MKKTLVAIGVSVLLAGCSTTGNHQDAHWGYDDSSSPEQWGMLADQWALCATGKEQSPIDIEGEHGMGLSAINFNYQPTVNPEVVNNGHTIQVNYAAGSYAVIEGKRYDLLQFHFHVPSEHTIRGEHANMVAHLVHKASDGQLAVIAVLFDQGDENAALKPIFDGMPTSKGSTTINTSIDVSNLLPANQTRYNYSGSLTTPPCSEGVNWNIMKTRMSVSAGQINAFADIFSKSVRPVQPINDRMIGIYND